MELVRYAVPYIKDIDASKRRLSKTWEATMKLTTGFVTPSCRFRIRYKYPAVIEVKLACITELIELLP
jgi:hypothetical protein